MQIKVQIFLFSPSSGHPLNASVNHKNRYFFCCKVEFTLFFSIKKRIFFHNIGYCGVDKKAVILQSIKNALFGSIKT